MDIRQIIELDPRVVELKQQYNMLLQQKNSLILNISHVEGDIIKLMGKYEAIAQEIMKNSQNPVQEPPITEASEPVEVVAEPNQDDGFAEIDAEIKADEVPVNAENTNPPTEA